ncbi:MAG: PRC-barrel domain containing protein [Chitinophagaceae bacterium]|nr:MAG: PRC-barrel domain containing protein [Chitinophagaceae bacterium]
MAYEEENKYNRLEELNGSNYQIVEGEPDITGWDVIDGQGHRIGEVDDVLFNPQTRDVRYIIVDLSENELDIVEDKKVLVPIGIAELRDEYDDDTLETDTITEVGVNDDAVDDEEALDEEIVFLPSVTAEQLLALPAYDKDSLSPEYETCVRNVFEPPVNDAIVVYEPDTFYTHEHFNNKIYPRNDSSLSGRSGSSDI